jgi:sulfate/thiosulfate transport system ATP-binding protein
VGYVRPHELEIIGESAAGAWPATLSQTLTVGPNTRIEFQRELPADASGSEPAQWVEVELPRAEFALLQQRLGLQRGSLVWLRPRKVTRFLAAA